MKKDYDIKNYDCRKAYSKNIDPSFYLGELEKANRCFKTVLILEK